jgi:predicted nuclease of predicted toxin-antitoxin system
VRLLLDANLSPRRVGSVLEKRGHDVLSLASNAALGALDDPQVLELATREDRIVVTRNSQDFAPLLREWAEAGHYHAGCILIWTLGHHELGAIIKASTGCWVSARRRAMAGPSGRAVRDGQDSKPKVTRTEPRGGCSADLAPFGSAMLV